ncbi:MAG TPA: methylated-DNA--[protein]-cysteine S-methyltransferase [Actinomycetota bacterium]|jgi:methylated-DNA-[protein]-cysteine S-methyltransferase|nr:methylated-DNA--[protein]-cysteine S-methyltransferase [Actinomycetota bacterium]
MNGDLKAMWTAVDVEAAAGRATTELVARASRAGLIDVAVAVVDSPVGSLLIAGTPKGLVRVAFPEEGPEVVMAELAEMLSPRVLEAPSGLDPVRRELDEYFEGRRRRFDLDLDWTLAPGGFSRRVLRYTARIPFGSVSTYGQMARRAGSPRAARAAGNALHDNPIPIVVPCHRVVPSSGGVGKYGGSEWRKRFLLELEGAVVPVPPNAGRSGHGARGPRLR